MTSRTTATSSHLIRWICIPNMSLHHIWIDIYVAGYFTGLARS